jgi:hypothetical protein
MKARPQRRAYSQLTAQELDRIAEPFDRGRYRTRAMTATDRALHRRARRPGRPRIGLGAQKIRISIEKSLLRQTDELARTNNVSRSSLIARALRTVLASAA